MRIPSLLFTFMWAVYAWGCGGSGPDGEAGSGGPAGGGQAGSAGEGGSGGAGGDAGEGGAGGSSVSECAALYEDMFVLRQLANECDPVADTCTSAVTIKDHCGCDVPVSSSFDRVDEARAATQAFTEHCETGCGQHVVCPSIDDPTCVESDFGYRCAGGGE